MGEMGRCRDCRSLGRGDRDYGMLGEDGRCLAVQTNKGQSPSGPAFIAIWGRSADGWLCTAPDFGCVQFEAKAE